MHLVFSAEYMAKKAQGLAHQRTALFMYLFFVGSSWVLSTSDHLDMITCLHH